MDFRGLLKADLIAPLHSWDILSMYLLQLSEEGRKKCELKRLYEYHQHNHWVLDLDEILKNPYEALVLTNPNVSIEWVSGGFTKMTGYTKCEVVGKSPSILHGKNTTVSSKSRVREKLFGTGSFKEELVNYRKNGEEYICRIEIFPIFNTSNSLSHYLALEQEVK